MNTGTGTNENHVHEYIHGSLLHGPWDPNALIEIANLVLKLLI